MQHELFFSEYFEIRPGVLQRFGALNLCLEADLPLFIDPFLLFASKKRSYVALHEKIVGHLIELKKLALEATEPREDLFCFPEVRQNWLGVCKWGNRGRGLGKDFARKLIRAFKGFFRNFGEEELLESSHIEKLTLMGAGIGRDFISDFTANLALEFLLEYSEKFARKHLRPDQRRVFSVRCVYDSRYRIWKSRSFELPFLYKSGGDEDFIVLTPLDILSKDEAFISHSNFVDQFRTITNTLDNSTLRSAVNEYFSSKLPRNPKQEEIEYAIERTVEQFPIILDYYIQHQEQHKDRAAAASAEKVEKLRVEVIETIRRFVSALFKDGNFYRTRTTSYAEALARAKFLQHVIEDNDGYRIFYKDGKAIAKEETIQRIFRLTWFSSPYDVNSEVNNGRGPADYKVSFGERDSTIVEFKLGGSSSLERNLLNQVAIYKKTSKSINDICVILCYTRLEIARVKSLLKKLKISDAENIIVIDGSPKSSASRT